MGYPDFAVVDVIALLTIGMVGALFEAIGAVVRAVVDWGLE